MTMIYSDEPIVTTQEFSESGSKTVIGLDDNGTAVRLTIYDYSERMKRQKEKIAETARFEYVADPTTTDILGEIDWEITDAKSGRLIEKGVKVATLDQVMVQVMESPDGRHASISFPLCASARLALVTPLSTQKEVRGFAMNVIWMAEPYFCWEWFQMGSPTRAIKLQECGELEICIGPVESQWQIVNTEFLTDISLRVAKFGQDEPTGVSYRVLVRKGTSIAWPILVNGQVVMS